MICLKNMIRQTVERGTQYSSDVESAYVLKLNSFSFTTLHIQFYEVLCKLFDLFKRCFIPQLWSLEVVLAVVLLCRKQIFWCLCLVSIRFRPCFLSSLVTNAMFSLKSGTLYGQLVLFLFLTIYFRAVLLALLGSY